MADISKIKTPDNTTYNLKDANAITGSGTSDYLAKFNGLKSITNGPQLGSSTTTFLRNDGTWVTPTDTNNAVTQTELVNTDGGELLFSGTNDNVTRTEGAKKSENFKFAYQEGFYWQYWDYNESGYQSLSPFAQLYLGEAGTPEVAITGQGNIIANNSITTRLLNTTTINISETSISTNTITLTGSTGNIQATSLNGVTIGNSPKFTDTTYSSLPAESGGTDVSLVTTGDKYTWNNGCTDTKVTQTASSDNKDYEVLFSGTNDNTTRTEGVRKTNRLVYNPSNGRLMNILTFADASKSNNDVSADTWQGIVLGMDKSKRIISAIEDSVRTDGRISTSLLVRNYDTDGEQVANKGITMFMDKSGNLTYSVSDSGNFRSAIGLGVTNVSNQYSFTKSSGNFSISSYTAYQCGNVVELSFVLKGNGNAVSAGSNGFVGTISGGPLPKYNARLIGYTAGTIQIAAIDSTGGLIIRNLVASATLSSTSSTVIHGTFITS